MYHIHNRETERALATVSEGFWHFDGYTVVELAPAPYRIFYRGGSAAYAHMALMDAERQGVRAAMAHTSRQDDGRYHTVFMVA